MIATITTLVRRVEPLIPPSAQFVERLRRRLWKRAQDRFGHAYTFVREKGRADYIRTVEHSPSEVATLLYANGYQRNLASTVKYRTDGPVDGRQYIHSAWVYDPPETDTQHDVFIFAGDDGCDIYGHKEPSVRNPAAHLDLSTGIHGDPDGRIADIFDSDQ